jgi:hypothetical protein
LRHWRKGKSKAALEPQRINYSNSNKNNNLQKIMIRKFLDASPSTSISPMSFCPAMKK